MKQDQRVSAGRRCINETNSTFMVTHSHHCRVVQHTSITTCEFWDWKSNYQSNQCYWVKIPEYCFYICGLQSLWKDRIKQSRTENVRVYFGRYMSTFGYGPVLTD